MSFPWPDDAIDMLSRLWDEGKSCSIIANEISAAFRCPVSRNAVIGKRARLGLPNRETTYRHKPTPRIPSPKPMKMLAHSFAAVCAAKPAYVSPPEPNPGVTDLFGLDAKGCRWPSGDGPFLFCNAPQFEGCDTRYCEHHMNLAHAKAPSHAAKYSGSFVKFINARDQFGAPVLAAEAAA